MGNFSRDSFQQTNVLNNLLGLVPVAVTDPRHYIGVRLQQGVPVLDADWNELEDIRRLETLAMLRFFIGNGVPAGDAGFRIGSTGTANNFSISHGLLLLDGSLVIADTNYTYLNQPNGAGLSVLNTPGASDRSDVAYLDMFEVEVAGADGGDARIIDNRIGIETAVRLERRWIVRVQENATDLSGIVRVSGHHYLPLARLRRRQNVAQITPDMIVDLRKTGITLAENLKIPLFMQVGLEILDVARFTQMANGLRTSLFERLRQTQFPHQTASTTDENILLIALQQVMNRAHIGEAQAASRNLNNQDALDFMGSLYRVQEDFVTVLAAIGNVGSVAQPFLSGYRDVLDGNAALFIKGLKLALDNQDLIEAVIAQETINDFLSAPVTNLPEGTVDVFYKAVIPFEALAAGSPYAFTFELQSHVTSPGGSEDFNLQLVSSAASWTISGVPPTVTLTNLTGKTDVTATVTPNAPDATSTITLTAIAARNPLIRSPQPGLALQIGVTPPVGSFFFYADSRLNALGRLAIRQPHLTRTTGRDVLFKIRNDNATQVRTYLINHHIAPNVADTTGWSPLAAAPGAQSVQVNPNSTSDFPAKVHGPQGPSPAPPIGTTGQIVASATLTAIDGVPVVGGASVNVQIDFEVVA